MNVNLALKKKQNSYCKGAYTNYVATKGGRGGRKFPKIGYVIGVKVSMLGGGGQKFQKNGYIVCVCPLSRSRRSSWTFFGRAIKSIICHQCTGNDLYAHLQAGEDILREAI